MFITPTTRTATPFPRTKTQLADGIPKVESPVLLRRGFDPRGGRRKHLSPSPHSPEPIAQAKRSQGGDLEGERGSSHRTTANVSPESKAFSVYDVSGKPLGGRRRPVKPRGVVRCWQSPVTRGHALHATDKHPETIGADLIRQREEPSHIRRPL